MNKHNLEIGDTILIVYKSLEERRILVTGIYNEYWRYHNNLGNPVQMTMEFLDRVLSGYYTDTIIHSEIIKND